ncbi:hypothetical protein LK996_01715 [Lysobacter sp. A6]|uniref:Uncharacterized protein n=1 Tax=Noviluteimonas lactosilytica TaxID=2888523 RepID=A0ABS8JE62_9GAMM|nr:hypothetical protein [Lysobacter lactosilyticus]MCC8361800.1 hypothetical protein [Lysobacter lactosilyticus]
MTADIPKAYQFVLTLAQRGGKYSASQLAELAEEAGRRAGFEAAHVAFEAALHRAQQAMDSEDDESLIAELINLRVCAMNIVADFDNLVDAISGLFESDSV